MSKKKKRIWDNIAAMDYQLDKAKTQGMEKGREEGMKEGMEKGREKGIKQTAINMLKQNLDNSLISSVTGLSTDEVLKLKNKL